MSDRNNNRYSFYPQHRRGPLKTSAPSQLAGLDGSRRPGDKVSFYPTKVPKRRFNVGDRFEFDGSVWEIIYMYRVRDQPGAWLHCLEERKDVDVGSSNSRAIGAALAFLGAGATTPRIVFAEFAHRKDVETYFRDIYRNGDSITRTTQELIGMKKVEVMK